MASTPESVGGKGMTGTGEARFVLGLDWFEWLCLIATAALSMLILGPLLATGRNPSGADGVFPVDQLQYLTWIRQASEHWLIGNEFDMAPDTRVFLHPGFLISGLVHRYLDVPLQLSYAGLWKPVSVLVVFIGCLRYTRRLLEPGWPRRVGLFLALFALTPWSALIKWTGTFSKPTNFAFDFISGEMWVGQYLQGYAMTAIATFAVPLILLGLEAARGRGSSWRLWACSLGALLVMWLQPWQGAELLIIVAVVELWRWRSQGERPWLGFAPVFVLGSLPAVYYWLLSRTDPAWKLAGQSNAADQNPLWDWPLWAVLVVLAPLALPGLLALRSRANDWQQTAVRVWPFAIALVFFLPVGTFPFHSVQGLSLPMAVLAVQGLTEWRPGWVPRPRWWWVLPALILMSVPGAIHKAWNSYDSARRVAYPWYLSDGEVDALRFLERDPRAGGVLTDDYSGLLVPPYTGREAYIGPFSWTPDYVKRLVRVNWVMGGYTGPVASRAFISDSGVRFIFQPCKGQAQAPRSMLRQLGPLIQSQHDFGCARVYVIRPTPRSRQVSSEIGGAGR